MSRGVLHYRDGAWGVCGALLPHLFAHSRRKQRGSIFCCDFWISEPTVHSIVMNLNQALAQSWDAPWYNDRLIYQELTVWSAHLRESCSTHYLRPNSKLARTVGAITVFHTSPDPDICLPA